MKRAKRISVALFAFFFLHFTFVAKLCLASMDPQSATSSATASIPAQSAPDDNAPPTAPVLLRPSDGVIIGDNTPELVWRQSSDPNGNTVLYTLYLNGVATFLGVSNSGNSAGPGYTAQIDGTEVRLIPTVALADGEYSWYVTATDLSDNTIYSQTWRFTIDTHPPPLTITQIDDYIDPEITQGANFDIDGPKDVYLTILSDPLITINLTITGAGGALYQLSRLTDINGYIYPYLHLVPGIYTVLTTATDQAHNQTSLPMFTITIKQAELTIPLPDIPGLEPELLIPYTPIALPSLPATISIIQSSREQITLAYVILLAIAIALLLIIIWKRRANILILDARTGKPIRSLIVYHSRPDTKLASSPLYLSRHEPLSYSLDDSDEGKAYIAGLNRYSTLTIRIDDTTHVLSLAARARFYTIKL